MSKWIAILALGFSSLTQAAEPSPLVAEQAGQDYVSGQRYYAGDGVPQDYKRAAQLFRRAADQGHAYAQYSLGLLYDHGYGVTQDSRQAIRWYELAAQQGHIAAKARLSALDITVKTHGGAGEIEASSEAEAPVALPPMPAEIVFVEMKKPVVAVVKPVTPKPAAAATLPAPEIVAPATAAAPPPETTRLSAAPSTLVTPSPASVLTDAAPAASGPDAAIALYQGAMERKDYAAALRALQDARVAGEVPQLGLNEVQASEVLARLAIMANDDMLALVYLRQASSLGSAAAQLALDRLANGADLATLAADFKVSAR